MRQTGPREVNSKRKYPSAGAHHFKYTQFKYCFKRRSQHVTLNPEKIKRQVAFWLQSTLKWHNKDEISAEASARKEGDQDHRQQSDWLERLCNRLLN